METLNQLKFARIYSLGILKTVKEEQWDVQPEGYNNTIRWNAGHIYSSMEAFVKQAVPEYEPVHPEWAVFFARGTKPADWKGDVPTGEELLTALAEQPGRVTEALTGKLSHKFPESLKIGNIHEMATVDAVIQFAVWHEGLHTGIISGLSKTTSK